MNTHHHQYVQDMIVFLEAPIEILDDNEVRQAWGHSTGTIETIPTIIIVEA